MANQQELIRQAFQDQADLEQADVKEAIQTTLEQLDRGEIRVAEKIDGEWKTNAWIKEAILLFFRTAKMETIEVGPFEFFDKVPLKKNLEAQKVEDQEIPCVYNEFLRFGSRCFQSDALHWA